MAFEIVYGRVIVTNFGPAGNSLKMRLGDTTYAVEFATSASLALQVNHTHDLGRDPTIESGPLRAVLYVTSGKITWAAADAADPF